MNASNISRLPARLHLVTVHNDHQQIVLETAPVEDLPPMADGIVGRPTDPPHIGCNFKAAPVQRTPYRTPYRTPPWFADDPLASRAIGWVMVAALVFVAVLLWSGQ